MIHRENPNVFLVFGTGYIGQEVEALLKAKGEDYHINRSRLENREEVARVLDEIKPTHVINTAGARGAPNADWCEDHKEETLRANVAGTINLVDLCNLRGIHVTHFGSGCIYGADDDHPLDGPGYTESDTPNFFGSSYGYSKIVSKTALKHFPNVLVLRIRFAIAANLAEKNHVTKILGYKRLVDMPSSGSMLPNLLPGALLLAKHRDTGVYNFTNPGVLGNNQIMSMFKEMIRPSLTWENFTVADQNKVLKSQRSTCALDSTKLVNKLKEYNYAVLDAETALRQVYQMMKDGGYQ